MHSIIRYVWLTAIRDRLFAGLMGMMLAIYGLSVFLAGTASVEQPEFLRSFVAGGLRLLLAVGLIVFTVFHIRRAFDQKEVDVTLSRPITRSRFVLAYAVGLGLVASLLTLAAVLVTLLSAPPDLEAFLFWALTLWLEALLLVTLSLAIGLILRSAVLAVLAGLSLYLMGRMAILLISTSESAFSRTHSWFDHIGPLVLQTISLLMPRLDLLAQTRWLIYGLEGQTGWILVQPLIYIPLLLTVAVLDFRRRQF